MIVVDASVVIDVLIRSPDAPRIEDRVFAPGAVLCVPHLLDVEVVQVLRRFCAAGAMTPARGRAAVDDLAAWPLTRFPHDPFLERLWALRANLTAYDATYVALAEALDAVLLTRDARLAATPGHAAAVEVI